MKKILLLMMIAAASTVSAFAHTAFTLVSSERKTIKQADLATLEKTRSMGKVDGSNLTFGEREIRLVVTTGPEDDMLSYRIQGVRNPNLVVPAGATIRILFVNSDVDMRHDIRFGHVVGEFPLVPEITDTAGSAKLTSRGETDVLQAEELVLKANSNGAYKYFCSVRGHAKDGMWGNVFVGVKPGANVKMAEKTEHVHSPDEDKDGHDHPTPAQSPSPAPSKKPDEHKHEQPVAAGHDEHSSPSPAATPATHQHGATTSEDKGNEHGAGHSRMMRSSINIGEPMSREGSGTSWIPDSSPTYAYMKMFDDGSMLMLHGTMFLRYTSIGSSRDVSVAGKGGRSRFDAPSMFMAMYSKPINEKSQIGLRAMVSLDPIIERGYGYPLLYQSGELFRGEPIHDRQHPHDFISELAATYSYKFDDKNSFFIYAGLPGEPALGPPMYLHRPSGMNNPDAPIGHHWQDATHITYGVVTAGFTHNRLKFEVSAFNGTEPDENRWAFDSPKLNSFSGRFSFNPTREWSFQISHGYLKYPERSEPDLKVMRRTTASAMYNRSFSENRDWANTFVWGRNSSDEGNGNSFLFESNYAFHKNAVFGRLEQVQKNAHELVLPSPHPEGNLWVAAYSLGYLREVVKDKGIDVGIGGMATVNTNPSSISSFYGGTTHAGWQFFVRLRPSRHR
ncbi:MAG TPA: sulfocyanin-like copper-binding protein [Pyrinomonadaceae bacterium]